jgi:hypothetical protein
MPQDVQTSKRAESTIRPCLLCVIASEAKQSMGPQTEKWIASSRSLSSGAHSRDPLAPRNDGVYAAASFFGGKRP